MEKQFSQYVDHLQDMKSCGIKAEQAFEQLKEEETKLSIKSLVTAMKEVYSVTPLEMAVMLKDLGYTPEEIVKGLRQFDETLGAIDIARILLNVDVYPNLKEGELRSALTNGGFTTDEVDHVICILYPKWNTKSPIPIGRRTAGIGVIAGKVYIVGGGFTNGGIDDHSNALQCYDPETDKWEELEPMPFKRANVGAVVADDKLYVIGGASEDRNWFIKESWCYDPVNRKWERLADMPTARTRVEVVYVDGKIHAIGGSKRIGQGAGPCTDHEVYDIKSNQWATYSELPVSRLYHSISAIGNKIYVVGGYNNDETDNKSNYVFDLITKQWSKIAPLKQSNLKGFAVNYKEKLFLIGGAESHDFRPKMNHGIQIYHPDSNKWDSIQAELNCPRVDVLCCVVNNTIYAITGSVCGSDINASTTNLNEAIQICE